MQFSNLIFLESFDILSETVRKKAQETSLCSDSSFEIWSSGEYLNCAGNALATLAVLPLVCPSTCNYFLIQALRDHIARMAENARFEGDWNTVRRILTEDTSLSIYDTWSFIMENMSPQDWFGNFVPNLVQALKAIRLRRRYFSVLSDTRPVRKPQRKRGYNDKGSRRSPHQVPKWRKRSEKDKEKIVVKEPPAFAWFFILTRRGSD